ncbi:MAG TPA: alpha/beta hydrolase, partial [Rhodanobacteraceae bacterium]
MNSRMIMRIVAVVVLAAVLGWQWWGKHHAPSAADAQHTAAASAVASTAAAPAKPMQPAPPATLRMGQLTLTACELKPPHSSKGVPAFCTKFPVPENRADPKSRSIDLKVAIVKSDSTLPAKDIVVYLAGGPGQSATETYP